MDHRPFGPAADGAGQVGQGGGTGAAGEDKFLQGGQIAVQFLHPVFQAQDVVFLDHHHARNAQLPP